MKQEVKLTHRLSLLYSVWPDVEIKKSVEISKRCTKNGHGSFYLKIDVFKVGQNLGYFSKKISRQELSNFAQFWSHWLHYQCTSPVVSAYINLIWMNLTISEFLRQLASITLPHIDAEKRFLELFRHEMSPMLKQMRLECKTWDQYYKTFLPLLHLMLNTARICCILWSNFVMSLRWNKIAPVVNIINALWS